MDNGLLLWSLSSPGVERSVLILIVMDNGLLPDRRGRRESMEDPVLILIVMDNGLLPGCRTLGDAADRLS